MEVDIVDLGANYIFFEEEFDFVIEDNTKDLHDRHALVSDLEIHAGTIVHKDRCTCLKTGAQERFKVRVVTLKNLWARLQIPPLGLFDRTYISWEKKINQGHGRSKVGAGWSLVLFLRVIVWDVTIRQGRTNIRLNHNMTQL
jgi:hypothetical protein